MANVFTALADDRSSASPANHQFETPAVGWGANAAYRRVAVSGVARVEWELGADVRLAEGETHESFRNLGAGFTRGRVAGGETSVARLYAEGSWSSGPWLVAGG